MTICGLCKKPNTDPAESHGLHGTHGGCYFDFKREEEEAERMAAECVSDTGPDPNAPF